MSDWDFADRLIPARSDLAAERLRGRVPAERYAAGERTSVAVALLDLRLDPDPGASLATQLLMGEPFEVYERRPDNLCWGQSLRDGYVGFVSADGLGPAGPAGVSVTALASHIYAEPDARAASLGALHFGAEVAVTDGSVAGFRKLRDGGYIPAMHLEPPAGSLSLIHI